MIIETLTQDDYKLFNQVFEKSLIRAGTINTIVVEMFFILLEPEMVKFMASHNYSASLLETNSHISVQNWGWPTISCSQTS